MHDAGTLSARRLALALGRLVREGREDTGLSQSAVGSHGLVADPPPGALGRGQPTDDAPPEAHERLLYLPVVTCCYAIVQYDAASAPLVRRIIGLFGDADCAETYAQDNGYRLYDVVPATAVIPTLP